MVGQSFDSQTQRKGRKGTPKSKEGCLTCRIRHVKCDEAKPACSRCSGTGRTCDFLQTSAKPFTPPQSSSDRKIRGEMRERRLSLVPKRDSKLLPKPSCPPCKMFPTTTKQEVDDFDYFRTASHAEPSIRYAVNALAGLHRAEVGRVLSNDAAVTQEPTAQYLTALNVLNQRLDCSAGGLELALMGSLLFMAFEAMSGNDPVALNHLEGGFGIMKEYMTTYPNLPGNLMELSTAFARLDIQASTFAVSYIAKSLRSPLIPIIFTSVLQARDTLNDILAYMYQLLKPHRECHRTLPYTALPATIATKVKNIEMLLKKWSLTFGLFLKTETRGAAQTVTETLGINVLRIQHIAACIHISTFFCPHQLSFEAYTLEFKKIIELANIVITDTASYGDITSFSADVGIIPALYLVACKCRDSRLRRQAIDLLKRAGREGVWDGQAMAAVATWAMKQEERQSEQHEDGSFIGEERRLREISLSLISRELKRMTLVSTRRMRNGTLEYVAGEVYWGQQAGGECEIDIEQDQDQFAWLISKWRDWITTSS